MTETEIKEKIQAQLEIEHQTKERFFALLDVSKELTREIKKNMCDELDGTFHGKNPTYKNAEEKLSSLTAERKELTITLNKSRRELAYLREMLKFT